MTIESMRPEDLADVAAINADNIGDVDPISVDQLAEVLESCRVALVAKVPNVGVVGFGIVVDSSCQYQSERTAWALAAGEHDLHLDRVAFDMNYSGLGLGPALYNELDDHIFNISRDAGTGSITLTSLVQIDPPNQHSIHFHEARSFETIDSAVFGGATIALTCKTYADA